MVIMMIICTADVASIADLVVEVLLIVLLIYFVISKNY
jgi:hypothetical protein